MLNGPEFTTPIYRWFSHYALRTAGSSRARHRRRHLAGTACGRSGAYPGPAITHPRQHNRQLNHGWRMRQRQDRDGIQLGTSVITANKECEHFLITGSPGAGNRRIRHMLTQIEQRGQSAIVLDPDCEFLQEFYNEGRGTWCSIRSIAAARSGHRGWNSARRVSPWTAKPWPLHSSADRPGRRPRNYFGNQAHADRSHLSGG